MTFTPALFGHRFFVLSLLLFAPLLRLLITERYGLLYPEVAVALGAMLLAAAFLAAIARNSLAFDVITFVLIVWSSAFSLKVMFDPVGLELLLPLFCGLLLLALRVLRSAFYVLLVIFLLGGLGADVVKASFLDTPGREEVLAQTGRYTHTLHIVFDGMQALGTLPPECGTCQVARTALERTLMSEHFRIFPYAFANYRDTRDSLPSILNNRLVERRFEFIPSPLKPVLTQNAYFDRYVGRGYDIRIYQSDYLLYAAPRHSSVAARTYKSNSLAALHRTSLAWSTRLKQLVSVYLVADWIWWKTWQTLTPPRFHPEILGMMPVASQEVWPDQVLSDIRHATKNTLFFVHLLYPHQPYVFRADGTLRSLEEWRRDRPLLYFTDTSSDAYHHRYELYGEQLQSLARQLTDFLEALKTTGQYDLMTVILHGDHGSRIRLLTPEQRTFRARLSLPQDVNSEIYDYGAEPDPRDLMNRFSTMLALRISGAMAPESVKEAGSVLYFLQHSLWSHQGTLASQNVNSVYLFTEDGRPVEIPMLRYLHPLIQKETPE